MRYFINLRYLSILPAILAALVVTACGTALPTVKPFKLDVQQGNLVTSKMLLQLRPGMTKAQARFIMGTPLIQDSFHGNRWDYVYQLREGGKIKEQRRVILDFESDLLKTVRGDVVPSGSQEAKAAAENIGTRVVEPQAKLEDKTLFDKLKFWNKEDTTKSAVIKSEVQNARQMDVPVGLTPAGQDAKQETAEAQKSLLAVPVEAMLIEGAAIDPEPTTRMPPAMKEVASEVMAPSLDERSVVPQTLQIESVAPQPSVDHSVLTEPEHPIEMPAQPTAPYESTSGMLFDRTLKFKQVKLPLQSSTGKTATSSNITSPKIKELPAENSTGFFDRMLEKIGF